MKEIRCKCCRRLLARIENGDKRTIELVCPKCGLRQVANS